jgi:hypothetical protein
MALGRYDKNHSVGQSWSLLVMPVYGERSVTIQGWMNVKPLAPLYGQRVECVAGVLTHVKTGQVYIVLAAS